MTFQRIEWPVKPQREYTEFCPDCGGGMEQSYVPCPDGNPRCLVLHYGWLCSQCGKLWGRMPKVDNA